MSKVMSTMAENIPSKTIHAENKLAQELMLARSKLRERSLIEAQKPYYKVRFDLVSLLLYHLHLLIWRSINLLYFTG